MFVRFYYQPLKQSGKYDSFFPEDKEMRDNAEDDATFCEDVWRAEGGGRS